MLFTYLPILGLTDRKLPRRLGPKRANHIRKLFNLKKEDDVRLYVVRRKIEKEGKKTKVKAPKIQRLITDQRLRRKRIYKVSEFARKRSLLIGLCGIGRKEGKMAKDQEGLG